MSTDDNSEQIEQSINSPFKKDPFRKISDFDPSKIINSLGEVSDAHLDAQKQLTDPRNIEMELQNKISSLRGLINSLRLRNYSSEQVEKFVLLGAQQLKRTFPNQIDQLRTLAKNHEDLSQYESITQEFSHEHQREDPEV